MNRALELCLLLALPAVFLAVVAAWFIPVAALQLWALETAGSDPLARFEAAGRAEAGWWLFRGLATAGSLLATAAAWRRARVAHFVVQVCSDARQIVTTSAGGPGWIQEIALVGFVGASLLLGGLQLCRSVGRRIDDWPVYRLHAGQSVLPNMSQTNRDVIRYVKAATPDDARILVFSDQAVYFLSYYLWPRRLLHRMHPESEFVIPQPGRQRAAYRIEQIAPDELRRFDVDYVLEYFESPTPAERKRRNEDPRWQRYVRHGDALVVLRSIDEVLGD